MAYSKASIKKKYDALRAQLKAGKITAAEMAAKGKEMHKKYFSDDNKGQRAKDSAPPKPAARSGATNPPRTSGGGGNKPPQSSGRRPDGTSGKPMPSNPPGQRKAPPKPKTKTEPLRNRRGRTVGTQQVPVKPPKPARPKTNRRGRRV